MVSICGQGEEEEDGQASDTVIEEAFAALQQRSEMSAAASAPPEDFRCGLEGGHFTLASFRPNRFYRAAAGTDRAKAWCKSHRAPQSQSFAVEKFGAAAACRMAAAWCHKMQYYLNVSAASGQALYRYSAADIAGYAEEPEFSTFVEGLTGVALARAQQIRDWAPRPAA